MADRSDRAEKLAGVAIPYAKVYDKYIVPQETLENILQYLHEDLDTAIELFLNYSPESKQGKRPEDYTEIPAEDTFFDSKLIVYRMNLRAALATRMRLNMWEGNYAAANKDVQTLKDNYQLTWIAESDLLKAKKEQDLAFSKEMLFGLEGFKRYESVIEPLFRRYIGNEINKNPQLLSLLNTRANEIYERDKGLSVADWRCIYWWEKSEETYAFEKFYEEEGMVYSNNIPLLRTPEIYYAEGQNLFPSKGVRRTTTPNNGKFVDSPSFNSESRTISNKATKEKTNYKIYTKEYVDQKHIPDEFELTEFAYPKKGSTVSWILTPDTSNCRHVKIFSFYRSGSMSLREKVTTDLNKYFDYKFFDYTKEMIYNKEIPLLIIYEADIEDRIKQKTLKSFLHDGKLDPNEKDLITSKLNRYIIVYYIAN